MSDTRVEVVTTCEHGNGDNCPRSVNWALDVYRPCHGGERRTLTPGEYVLVERVDGEWPELEAITVDGTLDFTNGSRILDALASVAGKDT